MYFSPSPEQEELRASVRAFLDSTAPQNRLVETVDSAEGYDAAAWKAMAQRIGLQGLMVPENLGGSGASFVENAMVLEEVGRALVPGPLFGCLALVVPALLECPSGDTRDRLLAGISDGSTIPAIATPHPATCSPIVAAAGQDGLQRLSGRVDRVLVLDAATVALVFAQLDDAIALFSVDLAAEGVQADMVPALDVSRREGTLTLTQAPAEVLIADAGALVERLTDIARVMVAAEAVGSAQRCLDDAVRYAGERTAFGKPIGSFQALKHKMATMYLEVEVARTVTWYAAWLLAEGRPVGVIPLEAKMVAAQTLQLCARSQIEILGGIGYTWEHPAHLYFKRATSTAVFLETAAEAADAIADAMLTDQPESAR